MVKAFCQNILGYLIGHVHIASLQDLILKFPALFSWGWWESWKRDTGANVEYWFIKCPHSYIYGNWDVDQTRISKPAITDALQLNIGHITNISPNWFQFSLLLNHLYSQFRAEGLLINSVEQYLSFCIADTGEREAWERGQCKATPPLLASFFYIWWNIPKIQRDGMTNASLNKVRLFYCT